MTQLKVHYTLKGLSGTFCLAASAFLFSACKTSGDLVSDRNYVDPTGIKTVEVPTSATSPAAAASTPADESLQQQLAVAQGELENQRIHAQQDQEKLQARIAELEAQNKALQDDLIKLKAQQPVAPVAAAPTAGASPTGKTGAPMLWELATNDLKGGRASQALSPLEELVKSYPKDKLAPQALLALGAAQYKTQSYNDAALTFNSFIEKYPKHKEASFAWYGQGAAFAQMKELDNSKLLFEELTKRFPTSPEASSAKKIVKRKEKVPADLFPLLKSAHPGFSPL